MNGDGSNERGGNPGDSTRAASPPKLMFTSDEAIALTQEITARLNSAVRTWRRLTTPERDLVGEIEALLRERPGSSTTEIARAVRARDRDVRVVLNSDPRFQQSSPRPGRSRKRKPWILASTADEGVPYDGTGRDAGPRRTRS